MVNLWGAATSFCPVSLDYRHEIQYLISTMTVLSAFVRRAGDSAGEERHHPTVRTRVGSKVTTTIVVKPIASGISTAGMDVVRRGHIDHSHPCNILYFPYKPYSHLSRLHTPSILVLHQECLMHSWITMYIRRFQSAIFNIFDHSSGIQSTLPYFLPPCAQQILYSWMFSITSAVLEPTQMICYQVPTLKETCKKY